MIALKINRYWHLYQQLLKEGMCDHFLLQEAVITQAVNPFTIDGSLQADYFDSEETENLQLQDLSYVPFSLMRPALSETDAGQKETSLFLNLLFLLSPANQLNTVERAGTSFLPEDVSGMYLHFTYKNETLTCTTGISYRKFSLDKTLDQEWDRLVPVFLRKNGIAAEPV